MFQLDLTPMEIEMLIETLKNNSPAEATDGNIKFPDDTIEKCELLNNMVKAERELHEAREKYRIKTFGEYDEDIPF